MKNEFLFCIFLKQIGPHGNTVLLSNGARDMQQVLLAGGPYPADGLVSSLEMCARRSGASLPAIGQLTFDHLAPLRKFVDEHCSASRVNKTQNFFRKMKATLMKN